MYANGQPTRYIRLACTLLPIIVILLIIYYADTGKLTSFENFSLKLSPKLARRYRNIIVHLDLKGAPPKLAYLEKWFKLLAENSVDGILIEYEDMFPYWGELEQTVRNVHYTKEDIRDIQIMAAQNGLEVIPLIQTFGHLEFLLEKKAFSELRESFYEKTTICVSDQKSLQIVKTMIDQIRILHPNSTRIHIGTDEANPVGTDGRCVRRMEKERIDKEMLKLKHIEKVGKMAKDAGFETVFAWNDMFDKNEEKMLKEANLDKVIVPVVWGYATDVTKEGYFPNGLFDRLKNVFNEIYLASAFKGANGKEQTFLDIHRYFENHKSYDELMELNEEASKKVAGIFLTGWSRFSHDLPLCELLPVSIPSLVANLNYLNEKESYGSVWDKMKKSLECKERSEYRGIMVEWALKDCKFPGEEVFQIIQNDWKQVIDRKKLGVGRSGWIEAKERMEAIRVLARLKTALQPIYYERDVDDICSQYMEEYSLITVQPT